MRIPSILTLWILISITTPLGAAWAGVALIDGNAVYPEGPLWHEGKLLYVEYAGEGIKLWDGNQARPFWSGEHCGASGLINTASKHLWVACYDANQLVELDENGRQLRVIDKDSAGNPFVGPNDFAQGAGGIYVSASGVYDLKAPISGTILYLSAAGTLIEVAKLIHYSNGLAVSKDGKSLLVSEMLAGRILSFSINADGSLGPRTVWARLEDLAPPTPHEDGYNGPDGLKLGPDGNYYIAQNGSSRVLVVDEDRKLIRTIHVPTRYVTNMNFGPGTDTVYITGVFDPWHAPFRGAVYRWTP